MCSSLYNLVRHPIYVGYLLTHVSFLLGHVSLWNAALLITADAALLVRAAIEERTLALDPAYSRYKWVVPWRLVPGVY